MKSTFKNRRDMCFSVGRRAGLLNPQQAAVAWAELSRQLEGMGDMDVPKFRDVMDAIRSGTIAGRQVR
jgi:hypothetical protein